jgi:hypothetical protein
VQIEVQTLSSVSRGNSLPLPTVYMFTSKHSTDLNMFTYLKCVYFTKSIFQQITRYTLFFEVMKHAHSSKYIALITASICDTRE